MILTDKFTVINFPKTGSTFLRSSFKQIRKSRRKKSIIRKAFSKPWQIEFIELPDLRSYGIKERYLRDTPHGQRFQIPENHQNKPVIAIKRNPFERLVSLFEFKDWKKFMTDEQIQKYSSFEAFVKYQKEISPLYRHKNLLPIPDDIGPQTLNLILFFSKSDPFEVVRNWSQEEVRSRFRQEMDEMVFLENANLNQELFDLLLAFGYNRNEISFVIEKEKKNQSVNKPYDSYFSEDLTNFILSSEKFLFEIFPEYLPKNVAIR